jgi:hypothetical protein
LEFSIFFQAALPLKPEVIGIDQVLNWDRAIILPEDQAPKLAQYEKFLRGSILRSPKLVLGAKLGLPDDPQVIPPLQPVPFLRNVHGPTMDIPDYTAIEIQPSEDYRLSSTLGFTNLPPARDRFDSVPMLLRYRGQVIPTFTLQAVLLWAKLTPDDVSVEIGSYIEIGKKIRVPIDSAGRMRVDFGTPYQFFGFGDLMLGSEQKEDNSPPIVPIEKIAGSIVLLSRIDAAARKLPLSTLRDGAPGELFASAIATIQSQSFIHPAPAWAQYGIIAAFMLLSFFVPRWKKRQTVLFGLLSLVVYAMVALAVFGRWLVWLPGVVPVGAVAVFVLVRVVTPDSFGKPKKPVFL